MNSFLSEVAEYLHHTYKNQLHQIAIIFPNRRASLFFGRYLANLLEKPAWAPSFLTISDLMGTLSGLKAIDNLAVVAGLYRIYKEETGSNETFDEFYPWGEIMLSDFDEIDKYKADPELLFRNIIDLKEITETTAHLSEDQIALIQQFWSSFNEKPSSEQKRFLSVFRALPAVYARLKAQLLEQGNGYEGLIYREATTKLEQESYKIKEKYHKVIFIGFAAINQCERELFSYLQKENLAAFFWDYDKSWIDDKNHEASVFVRKHLASFPMPDDFNSSFDHLYTSEKNIFSYAIPSNTGQAQVASTLLAETNLTESPERTAVVLTDENLLLPVLYALPEQVKEVNITMGYPLKISPVYSLFEHFFDLNEPKNIRFETGKKYFYYKPVHTILRHELISHLIGKEADNLLSAITQQNLIYIDAALFKKPELLSFIFSAQTSEEKYPAWTCNLARQLLDLLIASDKEKLENKLLLVDMMSNIYVTIQRLNDLIHDYKIILSNATYINLLRKALSGITVPFTGEPLKGLQVMGILETRNLDFENLIMLSMNEDVFPRSVAHSSFIPYSLRRAFGLTTPEYSDALYAYHFYRLIQRSRNIHLVYNAVNSGLQSGEKSRYLYQLGYDEKINLVHRNQNFDISIPEIKPIVVQKTNDILSSLSLFKQEQEGNTLSPSALNDYIDCRLRFYFSRIAGIKETNQMQEEMDHAVLGQVLHRSMELLYLPFVNKTINEGDLEEILKGNNVNTVIETALTEIMQQEKNTFTISGINIIKKEVIHRFITHIIRKDKKMVPFSIKGLEEKVYASIHTKSGNSLNLKGLIDRVDLKDGKLRIVDYKTGGQKPSPKDLSALTSREVTSRNSHQFQVLLYCLMYEEQHTHEYTVSPALYYMRNLVDPKYNPQLTISKIPISDFKDIKESFLQEMEQIIDEIFDPEIPFDQTENIKNCQYCSFNKICHRA